MLVRVLFFGQLKEIVGKAEDGCVAPEGARLEDVFANYAADFPGSPSFAMRSPRPSITSTRPGMRVSVPVMKLRFCRQ